jgi:uncharacterized membrane protein YraQ (UPF0718 family)
MEMGMTSGAAMAFTTSGAVSSIPAALAVYALVRKPIFVMYIILGLTGHFTPLIIILNKFNLIK